MPPASFHAGREGPVPAGEVPGAVVTFAKVTKVALWDCLFFSGKLRKGALREIFFFSENFPKGRYTYFSLVRKVPKETFFLLLFAACKK